MTLFLSCDGFLRNADAATATTQLNASVTVMEPGFARYNANPSQPSGTFSNWPSTIRPEPLRQSSSIQGSFGYPPPQPSR